MGRLRLGERQGCGERQVQTLPKDGRKTGSNDDSGTDVPRAAGAHAGGVQDASMARGPVHGQPRDALGVRGCQLAAMPPHSPAGRGGITGAGPAKGCVAPTRQRSGRGLRHPSNPIFFDHGTFHDMHMVHTNTLGVV